MINFYTHNIKNNDLNIQLQISTSDEYDKDDEINEYTISIESDVVDIQ
jgi:hypothetical protein